MLNVVVTTIILIILAALAIGIVAGFWERVFQGTTRQDETYSIACTDGWRLAIHRYKPDGEPQGSPVLLCHGLSANRYSYDLPEAPSLAQYLRNSGRDVWVAELRGSGMSQKPWFFASEVPYGWTFEDHLYKDIPALIDHVKSVTGFQRVHWVGHSMGGMLILAHLCASDAQDIASVVVLGTPTDFSAIQHPGIRRLLTFRRAFRVVPFYPLTIVQRLIAPYARYASRLVQAGFWPPNTSPHTASRILALTTEFMAPASIWLQFGTFLETGVFGPGDGTSYVDRLASCTTPILALAGSKDFLAPEAAVFGKIVTEESLGKRAYHVFGKETGCLEDYGHVDLLVGDRAQMEVYPTVMNWLREQEPLPDR